jgi:hypothetical protein
MKEVVLALDLSTTCTGWSLFSLESKALLEYGCIQPRVKNPIVKKKPTYRYPIFQALKIKDIVEQILELIQKYDPKVLAIEEVVSHKSRLTGKVLDGLHFVLVDRLISYPGDLFYVDVSGTYGWRPFFGIKLSAQDKLLNTDRKKLNKKLRGKDKLPIIDWKTLSSRFVNDRFKLTLDPLVNSSHGDMADSIMVGLYYLEAGEDGRYVSTGE